MSGTYASGGKPLPKNVHLLHGNPGKRALNNDEPAYDIKAPIMPRFLGAVARREWRWIVPRLRAAKILAEIDRSVLVRYCLAMEAVTESYQLLRRTIDLESTAHVVQTPAGKWQVNPYHKVIAQYTRDLAAACMELGLSPCARTRINTRAALGDLPDPKFEDLF